MNTGNKPNQERKLTKEEKLRYGRQRSLPDIGNEGQLRLLEGKVAVIGCGALGSLCAMYLAGAGVGEIRICDFDTIDISNLQRQLFFSTDEAGKSKAEILAKRINALNPDVKVEIENALFTNKTAERQLNGIDFVIEATDNPASKYLADEYCGKAGIACCIGGVREFSGQVLTLLPGSTRYSDLYPERPEEGGFTPCSVGGVLGPAAGIVASLQAGEAIKYITGAGQLLTDKIFTFDLLDMEAGIIDL